MLNNDTLFALCLLRCWRISHWWGAWEFLIEILWCLYKIKIMLASIVQSNKVHDAYYLCNWYESSTSFRKCLSICIVATQEPLHLSAGKAYIFCLSGFTDVCNFPVYLIYVRRQNRFSITIQLSAGIENSNGISLSSKKFRVVSNHQYQYQSLITCMS